jgi:hypothetical protein
MNDALSFSASVLATLLLALAALLILLVNASSHFGTGRVPSGPDSMGLAGPFVANIVAFVLLLVVGVLCAARGGLSWITVAKPAAGFIAAAAVIGLGVVSTDGFIAWTERRPGAFYYGNIVTFLAPLALLALLLRCAWIEQPGSQTVLLFRASGLVLAALSVGGHVLLCVLLSRIATSERRRTQARLVEVRQDMERASRRAAMTPAQRLSEDFSTWNRETALSRAVGMLVGQADPQCQEVIIRFVQSLPSFDGQLARTLRSEYPTVRAGGLEYIRIAERRPTWASHVQASMHALAAQIREAASLDSTPYQASFDTEVIRALEVAALFPEASFAREIGDIRDAIAGLPRSSRRDRVLEVIDRGVPDS